MVYAILMLMHHEIHVAHNATESEALTTAGFPPVTDAIDCASCGDSVGCVDGKFVPLAFVLNEDHEWPLCLRCASPCLWPRN